MEIQKLKEKLIEETRKRISCNDPSHDFNHAYRVLTNAEYIQKYEGGDLEIIIPAALFHDAVTYPKDSSKSNDSILESVKLARKVLLNLPGYPKNKIPFVEEAIAEHSYTKGIRPKVLESQIIQDADRLEATGAVSIMRTFSSAGQMKKMFYLPENPFCKNRNPECLNYAIDLFYERLLKVGQKMNTKTAKKMAQERTQFLYKFLTQLKKEI